MDPIRRMTNSPMPAVASPTVPTLRNGSRGEAVAEMQRLLAAKGYNITADGAFGPRTQAAVVAFQRSQGLTADGIVGARTWAALRSGSTTTQTQTSDNFQQTTTRPSTTTTTPTTTTTATTNSAAAQLAAGLVHAKGTATSADTQAVARELQQLPPTLLQAAQRAGVDVMVCRTSVTDYMTELKGVRPRGWPPGSTWDQVPGLYSPSKNEVVIATESRLGGRIVSTRHGSENMVFHELGHSLDATHALGSSINSKNAAFRAAYNADVPRLQVQNQTYLLQEGDAGPNEAFAETFARYYNGDSTLQRDLPAMYAYWHSIDTQLSR